MTEENKPDNGSLESKEFQSLLAEVLRRASWERELMVYSLLSELVEPKTSYIVKDPSSSDVLGVFVPSDSVLKSDEVWRWIAEVRPRPDDPLLTIDELRDHLNEQ